MADICLRYGWDLGEIWLRYVWDMAEIWLRYGWYMNDICVIYGWDIVDICLRYGWNTGCLKKIPHFCFYLISLIINIFHLKGGMLHRSVWNTKTFSYIIRKLRYKQNNMGYRLLKILNIIQSRVLKTDTQCCFPYISALECCAELSLNFKNVYVCHFMYKLRWYQISIL